MNVMIGRTRFAPAVLAVVVCATVTGAQPPLNEARVIVEFQRAADAYAFGHRQTERRGAAMTPAVEGALFTPQAAAVLRSRIQSTLVGGCAVSSAGGAVPRVNGGLDGTAGLPACMTAVLPRLPDELQYRSAGVALILADAHLSVVVDILHAAFPVR
jgi:hypothetical protein